MRSNSFGSTERKVVGGTSVSRLYQLGVAGIVAAGSSAARQALKSPARSGAEWWRDLMLDDFVFGVGDLIHQPPLKWRDPDH